MKKGSRSQRDAAVAILKSSPSIIWLMFFTSAFLTSFPLIAMVDWLNNWLEMSLATQSQFFAVSFVPFCLKPMYAIWLSSINCANLQSRRKCIILQTCGAMSSLLFAATWFISSIPAAFFIFFFINICDACSELVLDSYLLELAHDDIMNAGAVQAIAGGARALGSVSASLACLAIYPCDSTLAPNSRSVLACTSLIPAFNLIFASFLPPSRIDEHEQSTAAFPASLLPQESTEVLSPMVAAFGHDLSASAAPNLAFSTLKDGAREPCEPPPQAQLPGPWRMPLAFVLVLLVQAALVVISVEQLLLPTTFWSLLAACVVSTLAVVGVFIRTAFSDANLYHAIVKFGVPSIFLFAYNAVPSSAEQLYTYQFYLFYASSPCRMTYLSLVSSVATVLSYAIYAFAFNRRRIQRVFMLTGCLGVGLGLLWLPLARLHLHPTEGSDSDPTSGACVSAGPLELTGTCVPPFAYALLAQFVTSVSSLLAFAPSAVLATEATAGADAHRILSYSVLISLVDSGGAASGWVTSAIVRRLGITYSDWHNLPTLLLIVAASQLFMVAFAPLLRSVEQQRQLEGTRVEESESGEATSDADGGYRRLRSERESEFESTDSTQRESTVF
jgi:hypothetical protein